MHGLVFVQIIYRSNFCKKKQLVNDFKERKKEGKGKEITDRN
jgi:hypothetical protein